MSMLQTGDMVAADQAHIKSTPIMRQGMEPFHALAEEIEELQQTLSDVAAVGGTEAARQIQRLSLELDSFAPAVTFIGQIKAGKTSLVNALSGHPGLLPADVNPWTSVVTSLHLQHVRNEGAPVASFTFFEDSEWDKLIEGGGRIGELSARAGADKEHAKLVAQVNEMREKTKQRLGRKFEMLLGQTHRYNTMEEGLIERYVCLGDDFDTEHAAARQGQFADITKSAELFLDAPALPMPLTLRDTPGMNDTFLMREQITIGAIRDSRICVVVLSAHQALNTVDLGLIRMIANVQARQAIIFVNRADELSNPQQQIPEIRQSLRTTLKKHGAPADIEIIFGSALWANAALNGDVASLPDSSLQTLEICRGLSGNNSVADINPEGSAWIQSGVPELYAAMGERIRESSGASLLEGVSRRAGNVLAGLKATEGLVSLRVNSDQIQKMSPDEIEDLMNRISDDAHAELEIALSEVFGSFKSRVAQAHTRYVSRALDSLVQHLEENGDNQVWSYSADGLRMLMRSNYQVMLSKYRKHVTAIVEDTAVALTEAYGMVFDVTQDNFSVSPPEVPELPAPVGIAQTIVLDIHSSWWKRWWTKRRGYRAFAESFKDLIEAETAPMIEDLTVTQVDDIRRIAADLLDTFLEEQFEILEGISAKSNVSVEDLNELFGVNDQSRRAEMFDILADELRRD